MTKAETKTNHIAERMLNQAESADPIPEDKIAEYLGPAPDMNGHAGVYRLNVPLNGYGHVVVSAVMGWVTETYIFGCDTNGRILNWSELDGSYKGKANHEQALSRAGYRIV